MGNNLYMTFDKNNVAMIAVGALIVGGLAGIAIGNERGDSWRSERDGMWGDKDGTSMMDHNKMGMNDTIQSSQNKQNDVTRGHMMPDGTMMGGDMDGMHDMSMMVQSEQEFIMGMIPHHEEAIASAKDVIARGGSTPEIKTLAENIVKAQEVEVASMKEWYKNWYGKDYVADGKYKLMMRDVSALTGAELDKVFLTDMIMHHRGALMMAQSVSSHIKHTEMTTLVENIKTTQSAEITQMQNVLKTMQ